MIIINMRSNSYRCIKDKDTVILNKLFKKYDYSFNIYGRQNVEGSFKIVRYRKYPESTSFHIKFQGKILANFYGERDWYDSSILKNSRVSKVRINRILKQNIMNDLFSACDIFSLKYHKWTTKIYKLEWV